MADGTTTKNILEGVAPVLQGLFGNDGFGNDVSAVMTAGKNNPNQFPFIAPPGTTGTPWVTIILVAGIAFVAFMIFKK